MMEPRENSFLYSPASKAIGVLILCLCGSVMLVSLISLIMIDQLGVRKDIAYQESASFERRLRNEAYSIEHMYDSGTIADAEIRYAPSESNVQFALETYDPKKQIFAKAADNISPHAEYGVKKEYVFGVLQQGYERYSQYYYTGELALMPKDAYHGYRVTMAVQKDFPVRDAYQNERDVYVFLQEVYGSGTNAMLASIASGGILLVVLVLEWMAAGRRNGQPGVFLHAWDRIPMDLFTVILFGAEGFVGLLLDEITDSRGLAHSNFVQSILPYLFAALIASLLFYVWLMSLARRIKAKTLWKNNLWRFALDGVIYVLKEYPLTMKLVLVFLTGWLIFAGAVLPVNYLDGGQYLVSVVLTLVFAAVIFYGMAAHHETCKAGTAIASGDFEYRIGEEKMKKMLGSWLSEAKALNSIGDGIAIAVEKQLKSERMKTELITNVSHDLRTPLTAIISYTDLLQKEHTEEQEKEYLEILMRQSLRLKKLSEDIMEASKASSGAITAELGRVEVKEMIDQALAEYQEKFASRMIEPVVSAEDNLSVRADGKLLWRIFSNLFSNIDKYAMEHTRVYIDAKKEPGGKVRISVKNISKDPLNIPAEELTERFVRGDRSRHSEGSGLGLSIVQSLCELMGGRLELSIDGDLFRSDLLFEEYRETAD